MNNKLLFPVLLCLIALCNGRISGQPYMTHVFDPLAGKIKSILQCNADHNFRSTVKEVWIDTIAVSGDNCQVTGRYRGSLFIMPYNADFKANGELTPEGIRITRLHFLIEYKSWDAVTPVCLQTVSIASNYVDTIRTGAIISPAQWKAQYNRANAVRTGADYFSTLRNAHEAVRMGELLFGKCDSDYTGSRRLLFYRYWNVGYYQKAVELARETNADCLACAGFDPVACTSTYFSLIEAALARKDYAAVQEKLDYLMGYYREKGKARTDNYSALLQMRSNLQFQLKQYEEAAAGYQEAIRIYDALYGENSSSAWEPKMKLAEVYIRNKQFEKAQTILEATDAEVARMLDELKRIREGRRHIFEIMLDKTEALFFPGYRLSIYNRFFIRNLWLHYLLNVEIGNKEETLHYIQEYYTKIQPSKDATCLLCTAKIDARDYSGLEPLLRECHEYNLAQYKNGFMLAGSLGSEYLAQRYKQENDRMHSILDQARYDNFPAVSELLYDYHALKSKGLVLANYQRIRAAVEESGNPALQGDFQRLTNLRDTLANTHRLRGTTGQIQARLDAIQREAQWLENKIAEQVFAFDAIGGDADWRRVRDQLGPGEAAIEFLHFDQYRDYQPSEEVRYQALVLRPEDSRPVVVNLCAESQLLATLNKTGAKPDQLYRADPVGSGGSKKADWEQLYKLVWEPVERYLGNTSKVYYSPSGLLHLIAFDAIRGGDGRPLINRFDLRRVLSTKTIAQPSAAVHPSNFSMALFGGLDYNADSLQLKRGEPNRPESLSGAQQDYAYNPARSMIFRSGFDPLPGTKQEVDTIGALLKKNNIAYRLFKGIDGAEDAFKNLCKGSRPPEVIHIASHGFYRADSLAQRLSADDLLQIGDRFSPVNYPLLRSGIVFAGANRIIKRRQPYRNLEDALLTGEEVTNLNLGNTKLVVLSACQTGLGDIRGSEGVYGLQRAFKMAGVRYLIVSLWKVDDAATRDFMIKFYQKWLSYGDIHRAFREAQSEMQARYPDNPERWAAFILVE